MGVQSSDYHCICISVAFLLFLYINHISFMSNKCALVRSTCSYVASRAKHVSINEEKLKILAERFSFIPFNEDAFHKT